MEYSKEKLAELRSQEVKLREQMGAIAQQMHERAETDEWTQDKTNAQLAAGSNHQRLKNELDILRGDIGQMEKLEPKPRKQSHSLLNLWVRGGVKAIGSDAKMFCDYDQNNAPPEIPRGESSSIFCLPLDPSDYMDVTGRQMMAPAANETTAGDAASGIHVVPRTDDPRIVEAMLYIGGISSAVYNYRSATGGEHRMRSIDDTAQVGAYLTAQNQDAGNLGMPPFTNVNFGSYTLTSKMYYETNEFINDAGSDIARILERVGVRRMARAQEMAMVQNAHNGTPQGLLRTTKKGVTTAAAAAFTWPETVKLMYSVNRAYRRGNEGSAMSTNVALGGGYIGYIGSDAAEMQAVMFTDSQNRPLWLPSIREGVPPTLNGVPFQVSGYMDAPAAGKIPLVYGNFSYAAVRHVGGMILYRIQDSVTLNANSTGFIAFERRDHKWRVPLSAGNTVEMAAHMLMKP